jgi:dsRNA-specific ribonuclease
MEDNTNERLEYLGDSVIALTVSHYRHERYKDQNEGFFDDSECTGDTLENWLSRLI